MVHNWKGVDIHLDTPTEVLHTFLLGIVKYWWGQTVHILSDSKRMNLLQSCLASLDTSGLNAPRLMLLTCVITKEGLLENTSRVLRS